MIIRQTYLSAFVVAAVLAMLACGHCFAGPATERPKQCAAWLAGFCFSYYTREEQTENEDIAALKAELKLRENARYEGGTFYVTKGWFGAKFPGGPTDMQVLCSYDDGMTVVYKDESEEASVKIPMDGVICDAIAERVGRFAGVLARMRDPQQLVPKRTG